VVAQLSDDAVSLLMNRAKKPVSDGNDLEKLVRNFWRSVLKMKLQKSPEIAVQFNIQVQKYVSVNQLLNDCLNKRHLQELFLFIIVDIDTRLTRV
jgi:hypothetical protein